MKTIPKFNLGNDVKYNYGDNGGKIVARAWCNVANEWYYMVTCNNDCDPNKGLYPNYIVSPPIFSDYSELKDMIDQAACTLMEHFLIPMDSACYNSDEDRGGLRYL